MDLRWIHIGWGNEKYASALRDSLRARLGDAVHFEGYISNDSVGAWYTEHPAAVFVNVSTSEGVPVSVMEAMRAGLPVVATDVGGTRELLPVDDQKNLLPADPTGAQVAAALRVVLNSSDEEYRAHSARMRSEWAERWDAKKSYSDFADELVQLLDRRER